MRLMNELHLYCPARRKHKHYCKYSDSAGTFEPNLLQRQFTALKPLQKWTTDITEFKAFGKKLYLSVILDMYNGEIINYTLTESASLASVQQLISQAITLLPQGTNLLFHSDRGWHYQQHCIKNLLANNGITQSMSRRGECYDNAIVETFFATLKNELFYVEKFKSLEHLASEIDEYIRYYNNERIRAKLNYQSPVEYRLYHSPI
jgi:transposase InsO family protein